MLPIDAVMEKFTDNLMIPWSFTLFLYFCRLDLGKRGGEEGVGNQLGAVPVPSPEGSLGVYHCVLSRLPLSC